MLGRIWLFLPDNPAYLTEYCRIIMQYLDIAGCRISGWINPALPALVRHCRMSGPTHYFYIYIYLFDGKVLILLHGRGGTVGVATQPVQKSIWQP